MQKSFVLLWSFFILTCITTASKPKLSLEYPNKNSDENRVAGNILFRSRSRGVVVVCKSSEQNSEIEWHRQVNKNQPPNKYSTDSTGRLSIRDPSEDDTGTYTCLIKGHEKINVTLQLFVTNNDINEVDITRFNDTMVLKCGDKSSEENDVTYVWSHNGKDVHDGEKTHIEGNELVIKKPSSDDTGMFMCSVMSKDGARKEIYFSRVFGPAIARLPRHSHPSKNIMQGERADLKCVVHGMPLPNVQWWVDGEKLIFNATRMELLPFEGIEDAHLVIKETVFEDRAKYVCNATNKFASKDNTVEIQLRIKDKLAALWPFLGIVAEVIILVAIIFLYERRQEKRNQDEDETTTEQKKGLTTGEEVDVRQRTVKA